MKKPIVFVLILVLILSLYPANAVGYSQFIFRNHIRWGMANETVQLFEGVSDLHHDEKFDFLVYKDVRVSQYSMTLEFDFVNNELVSAVYSTTFDSGVEGAYSTLKKALASVYGQPTNDYLTAITTHYSMYNYMLGWGLSYSDIVWNIRNDYNQYLEQFGVLDDSCSYWLLDDTEIVLTKANNSLMIIYFDKDRVTREDDTTGL